VEKLKEGGHLENTGIHVRIIRKQVLKKMIVREWTGLIWLGIVASRELL
jgi:hypothetical protein